MVIILVTNNDLYKKTLEKAFLPLAQDVRTYSDINEIVSDNGSEILVCLLAGQDYKCAQVLAKKMPVFAILPFQENIEEDIKSDFVAVFSTPLRLGRIVDAVRVYKQQKIQKEKLSAIKIGKYILDPKNNSLKTVDTPSSSIRLTEREQDILLYLHSHKEKSVSRQMLLDHVWGYADGVETHTLETHIYRLRQKIEKDPSKPDFLMTNDDGYYLNF